MRKFNPEKEFSKIKKGNKNKVLYSIIALLLIVAVGSTYALYQVRHTQKIAFNTVDEFKKRDIYLSVLVDGKTQNEFPNQGDGYVFDNIQCDKPGIKASFNNDTWELTLTTKTTNKCTVKFITKPYMDESGANYPDLFQGLIPIRYENNKIYIADYKQKWYDYNNNEWANAVLIDHTNPEVMNKFYTDGKLNIGTEIQEDDILQMYVWIPRYKYELWNVNNEGKPKQLINIKFENTIETTGEVSCSTASNGKETCINAENGNWYTHPAFTFGNTELRGIWVGKFEPSDPTDASGRKNNIISEITILPNKTSMSIKTVSTIFNATRNIELKTATKYDLNNNEIDTHMMKNMEWGAVAYLTQSVYGIYKDENTCNIADTSFEQCEVWTNNVSYGGGSSTPGGGTATGCVGTSISDETQYNPNDGSPAVCPDGRKWNEKGVNASTTGNVYGIYDMSGGMWEYVMGVQKKQDDTDIEYMYSGFDINNKPNGKYYDLYEYSDSEYTHGRGHLGDATRETLANFGKSLGEWNGDYASYIFMGNTFKWPWFRRGGYTKDESKGGIFAFMGFSGGTHDIESFRIVLTAQDGVD